MYSLNVHMLTDLKSIISCKTGWSDRRLANQRLAMP